MAAIIDWLTDNYFFLDALTFGLTCKEYYSKIRIVCRPVVFRRQWPNLGHLMARYSYIGLLELFDSWRYPLNLRQIIIGLSNCNMLVTPDLINYYVQKNGPPDYELMANLILNGNQCAFNAAATATAASADNRPFWIRWFNKPHKLLPLPEQYMLTNSEHAARWYDHVAMSGVASIFATYYCVHTGDVAVLERWKGAVFGPILETIIRQKAPEIFILRTIRVIVHRQPELATYNALNTAHSLQKHLCFRYLYMIVKPTYNYA